MYKCSLDLRASRPTVAVKSVPTEPPNKEGYDYPKPEIPLTLPPK